MTAPVGVISGHLQPWQSFDWPVEHKQAILRDWGVYFTQKHRERHALHSYSKSLELNPHDGKTLYQRSKCQRFLARNSAALDDSRKAAEITYKRGPPYYNSLINMEICDALYALNRFEDCAVELSDNMHRFTGSEIAEFEKRLTVIHENFQDSVGESLQPFLQSIEKQLPKLIEQHRKENEDDERPLWKMLKEMEKCDVLSVLEVEEELLSPLEIARRKRAFDVYIQKYLGKAWIDVLFLKEVRNNPNLMMAQSKLAPQYLKKYADTKYKEVRIFLKMLQARSPMYNERFKKHTNKEMFEKHKEDALFRIQYQTRRNMITVLRTIRALRAHKSLDKLAAYVEEVMGDYVVLKTSRIMPWKFEFLNEVYNTLALAYAEEFQIVPKSPLRNTEETLLGMLHIHEDKNKDRISGFVFGDRSTHSNPEAIDANVLAYRKLLNRFEKRMHFAKYAIEKSYLLHAMGKHHLQQSRYNECCHAAQKGIEQANQCNSLIWKFLNTMLICKSHASLHKVEKTTEAVELALDIAADLKSNKTILFMKICRHILLDMLELRKQSMSGSRKSMSLRRAQLGSRRASHADEDSSVFNSPTSLSTYKTIK